MSVFVRTDSYIQHHPCRFAYNADESKSARRRLAVPTRLILSSIMPLSPQNMRGCHSSTSLAIIKIFPKVQGCGPFACRRIRYSENVAVHINKRPRTQRGMRLLNTRRLVPKLMLKTHGVMLLNANVTQQNKLVAPSNRAPRPASAPVVVASAMQPHHGQYPS